ncbi:MAG: hypothetical protein GY758_17750, partial [Fuerstiella sp.]|nr:hypothetical protein [Fuerstiella sp.]
MKVHFLRLTVFLVAVGWMIPVQSVRPFYAADAGWQKHVIFEGEGCMTAVAADYTKDGVIDVIADTGDGNTRLFVGPDWTEIALDADHGGRYIHSET